MRDGRGSPKEGLVGATVGFFVGFAAVALFGPTALRFKELMGLSPQEVGLLVAIPALSGSLLRIPFGAWVDTTGGRKPFLILLGLALVGMTGLTLLVHLYYPERLHRGFYLPLLVLGVLCGCGIATFSVGIGQVSYWFPRSYQGRALAFYAGLGNLAPGLFSLLLPITLGSWGLKGAYLAWLLILAVGTVLYAFMGHNAWYFQFRQQGLSELEARQQAAARGQENFPTGNLVESLRVSALTWRTWALVVIYFTTFGGFVALTAWLPVYWSSFFGLGAITAGALTALYSLLTSFIRVVGGGLSDELERGGENTAILALMTMVNGALLMTLTSKFEVAVPGIILMAIGMGICNAAVFRLVPQVVPQAVGGAAGWVGGLGAFGGFIIPPIMGFAVQRHGMEGYPLGFVTFLALSLLSLFLVWILKYLRSETEPSPSITKSELTARPISDRTASTYRIIIDANRCWELATREGGFQCDRCVRVCPHVFEKPSPHAPARVRPGVEVDAHLSAVRKAIRSCPANAILLVEVVEESRV